MALNRIGVLGGGNIGAGVATDLILHGLHAVVVDTSEPLLRQAETTVLTGVRTAPLFSASLPRIAKKAAADLLTLTTDLNDVASCDFIVENVTEDWTIKQQVYQQLERVVPDHVCFGANTSCIPITRIAAVTRRPASVIGLHFMNPVHLKSTIEVIRGLHTSDGTLGIVLELLGRLNKRAVIVGDLPGFVSSRISHVFMNEAAFVMQDNVATARDIDTIFKECYGHRMGPLETADLIGLDTVMRSLDVLYESFHDPKYRCCPYLRQLVYAGHLGRKTGKGFYDYPTP